jgi:hypothetical protein
MLRRCPGSRDLLRGDEKMNEASGKERFVEMRGEVEGV